MFEVYLSCKRTRTTAKILNEKGYRTRTGAKFGHDTVRRLITNPIAKGLRRSNYLYDDGTRRGVKPESEWIYTTAPAIVSEETYDAVQNLLKANARPATKKARLPVHPFSGVTYCGCQKDDPIKMRVLSSIPDKYTCPKCRAKIPKTDLEDLYKQQLTQLVASPARLSEYAKSVDASIKQKQQQVRIAKDTLDEAMKKSQKYLDLYVDDTLSKEAFARVHDPLSVQITELENTIPELEKDIADMKAQVMQDAQRVYDSESLYEKWDSFEDAEKVQLIASLTDKILIDKDKVEINLHFIPSVINDGHLALNQPPTNATADEEWCGLRKGGVLQCGYGWPHKE
jgi:site-specific DNA recombinase